MNSPEKLSSAGTTPNKQVRGADRPSDHRGCPPEQPWLKVRTGVAKSPCKCGSHAGIYSSYDACMEEIENCIAAPGRVEDHYEAKVLARTIERFLDTLNRENRVIFMRRYWYSDSYAAIAALTGLTEKNVSVRLARVRKQLRDYLMKQGVLT